MSMQTETLTDEQIIAKHSQRVQHRARIELKIVNKLIEAAQVAGYKMKIYDYYIDEGLDVDESDKELYKDIKTALFDLDEAHVYIYDQDGERLGWIFLVFGNDGYDLISNYNTGLESFLEPINNFVDSL